MAVAVALALTACSGAEVEPAPAAEQAADQDSAAPSAAPDDEGGEDSASVDADLDDVLVEQTVAQPGNPDDLTTVGVRSLRVDGDVMVLELAVTPDFASVSDTTTVSLYDIWRSVAGYFAPTLLDREHLKRYSPLRGGPGQSFTSDSTYVSSINGEPMRAFAVFAAPEDDIDAIDVVLADAWPPFRDVPVER